MSRQLGFGLVLLVSLLVAGCGGGGASSGGSSGNSTNTASKTGKFSLAFSGGSAPGVKHAWLTIYKVAFNPDANRAWDPADTSWKVVTLSTPKTVDIAAPATAVIGSGEDSAIPVPVGTYEQVRLFLSPHDDTASPAAVGGGTTLTYKAQLDYESGGSVPIEIPNVQSGLKLDRGVIIAEGKWSPLTTRFDVDRSIVRFSADGAVDAVTLRPRTYTYGYDPTHVAYIFGAIDPTYVCGSIGANSQCASDITVSLFAQSSGEIQSDGTYADGTRLENWGTVLVNAKTSAGTANDGSFNFVVNYTDGDLNPRSYDLMIRGQHMKTMVIRNVVFSTVSTFQNYMGCSWTTEAGDSATAQTFIRPVYDAAPRPNVTLSSPLALKTGRVGLGFRLPAYSPSSLPQTLPYEVYSANTDPFSGALTAAAQLTIPSVASGDVLVTDHASIKSYCSAQPSNGSGVTVPSDLTLNSLFTSTAPIEGMGNFRPFAIGTFYTNGTQGATLFTGGATFDVSAPVAVNTSTGSVTVSITGLPSAGANKAQLVVSDVGGIVFTRNIQGTCTSSLCTETVTLPAGTIANATATGIYEFAVRYWDGSNTTKAKSAIEAGGTMRWARGSNVVNLRAATSGSVSIAVP